MRNQPDSATSPHALWRRITLKAHEPWKHKERQETEAMASAERRRRRNHQAAVSRVPPFKSGKPRASRSASQASATLRARLRIRPMVAVRSVTEITPRASSRLKVCCTSKRNPKRCRQLLLDQICCFRFIDGEQLLEPLGIEASKLKWHCPFQTAARSRRNCARCSS